MAAAQAMTEAGSYRFTGSITVGTAATKVTGEFEAPDRVHEVITTPKGQTVEVLFAGGKNFVHDRASGRWAVGAAPSRSSPQSDPRVAFSVLQDATDVTPTPDGDGVRFSLQPDAAARIVTLPAQSGAIVVSGRAALTGGDLSNLELSIRAGAEELDVVLGYTEIGVGPSVTLPTI